MTYPDPKRWVIQREAAPCREELLDHLKELASDLVGKLEELERKQTEIAAQESMTVTHH